MVLVLSPKIPTTSNPPVPLSVHEYYTIYSLPDLVGLNQAYMRENALRLPKLSEKGESMDPTPPPPPKSAPGSRHKAWFVLSLARFGKTQPVVCSLLCGNFYKPHQPTLLHFLYTCVCTSRIGNGKIAHFYILSGHISVVSQKMASCE